MDHIKNYFTGAARKLIEKKLEKESFIEIVREVTGIELKRSEINIKNGTAKLKIFGAKRTKILDSKDLIISKLDFLIALE